MTLAELDHLDAADMAEVDRLRRDTRTATIMEAPEAEGRQLVAFALLLRTDLSPDAAVLLLRQAPDLRTVDAVASWVEAIPVLSHPETRH
ncbi:hypothetical protein SAMN02799636_06005 [Methylobacterium sp. 275MFSha3.1]|uniref:hypothetical protein n=1 Tax=Methylobacterium sp. 275MFSha3.1 TaxID=1502746 RepID=UPI0008A77113|nr:hypothetical protein [Methylobacterium sp. 275MFSha3.1]SEI14991.1 hypothetical protein SAMN02799636_06005 [Methylobacterium sp. 275MFSha3.1]